MNLANANPRFVKWYNDQSEDVRQRLANVYEEAKTHGEYTEDHKNHDYYLLLSMMFAAKDDGYVF